MKQYISYNKTILVCSLTYDNMDWWDTTDYEGEAAQKKYIKKKQIQAKQIL